MGRQLGGRRLGGRRLGPTLIPGIDSQEEDSKILREVVRDGLRNPNRGSPNAMLQVDRAKTLSGKIPVEAYIRTAEGIAKYLEKGIGQTDISKAVRDEAFKAKRYLEQNKGGGKGRKELPPGS